MINELDRHRIGHARLLRRQGKTYDEIRAVIGPVTDYTMQQWLRGIPRPAATRRGKALDAVRRQCRQLRAQGLTYDEIHEVTGASVGSLSLWLSDLPRDAASAKVQRVLRFRATCDESRAARLAARAAFSAAAAAEIGAVTDRELFLEGLGLYWAEGGKSKPWRSYERVVFINSDPTIITVFMRWLALVGVSRDECRFRVSIHETADVAAAESYWADLLGASPAAFNRATIKRHRPTTNRLNTGDSYHGCLVVDVLKSAELYRLIDGWWHGLASAAVTVRA